MAENKTRVALVQMSCGPDPEKNFARALDFIRDAAKKDAAIVCLPELFRSQYFCQTEDHKNFELAEEIPGKSTAALAELAKELGVAIIASLFEKRRAGVYHNTAAIIAKGSVDKEEISFGEIDWARVNEHRTHWPFLRDRRVDAYSGIEQRLLD